MDAHKMFVVAVVDVVDDITGVDFVVFFIRIKFYFLKTRPWGTNCCRMCVREKKMQLPWAYVFFCMCNKHGFGNGISYVPPEGNSDNNKTLI